MPESEGHLQELTAAPEATSPSGSRWKLLAKKLALLTGTLSLLALGLEAGTRLLTDTTPPLMERDTNVGQRFVRSFSGMMLDDESGRRVFLRFNRDGLRGPDRPLEKPPGVRRVALFGDSMIASVSIDEDKTTVGQLERMLNKSPGGAGWEVMNFGICGSSTGQEMLLYREVASQYHPDIVLCTFFVGNDLTDNSSRLSNSPRICFDVDDSGKLVQLPFSASRHLVGTWLNRHSRFYVWQKLMTNRARHRLEGSVGLVSPGDWIFCSEESTDVAHAWDITAALLKQFRDEVESRGSLFAVVTVPSAVGICDDCFQEVARRAGDQATAFRKDYPDLRLSEICRKAGITLWSLTPDFRKAVPSAMSTVEEDQIFIKGVGHLNERGSVVAAKSLHRFLTEGDPQQVAGVPYVQRLR